MKQSLRVFPIYQEALSARSLPTKVHSGEISWFFYVFPDLKVLESVYEQ